MIVGEVPVQGEPVTLPQRFPEGGCGLATEYRPTCCILGARGNGRRARKPARKNDGDRVGESTPSRRLTDSLCRPCASTRRRRRPGWGNELRLRLTRAMHVDGARLGFLHAERGVPAAGRLGRDRAAAIASAPLEIGYGFNPRAFGRRRDCRACSDPRDPGRCPDLSSLVRPLQFCRRRNELRLRHTRAMHGDGARRGYLHAQWGVPVVEPPRRAAAIGD